MIDDTNTHRAIYKESKGIGLFLTKNQVESLGGKICAESHLNIGTTFYVYFLHKN